MKNQIIDGVVKRHPDGFGFVIPTDPENEDVFVSRGDMIGIMTNDKVQVEVFFSPKTNKSFGKVVKVLERGTKKVVGRFQKMDNGDGVILDKNSQWGAMLKLPFKDTMGAVNGDLVAVEIIQYPLDEQDFVGRVVEIIGDAEDPLNDIIRVIHSQNIPKDFPVAALREAEALPDHVLPEEIAKRKDLRDMCFITIDGATAKDFDDAIFVSSNPKGFHLWVAIADVSHYVKLGSNLDDAAYERGTSVYFPNYVVPMLPEKISNELCSLKPNVDRLAFVCEMQISYNGVVENTDIYEAVIHSKARVTYGEAQDVLTGDKPHALHDVSKNIKTASDLAKVLMAKRFREGSLEINVGETSVIVDDAGNTVDVVRSERLFAHRLIEELMLIANVSVAKRFEEAKIPALYRVHETPDMEDIAVLDKFLHNFGSEKRLHTKDLAKRLTKSLQEFEGKPEGIVLNILTLRSMMQAKYSNANIGHFGLGFEFYTHFTSPIRRYPDLIVHRLLKSLRYPAYKVAALSEEKLASAGVFLSGTEQRSVKAERQVTSIKKARFMKSHIGEVLEGVISSVARFGVFVLLRQFDVDGLVKSENLGNDAFEFDEENLLLRGKRTKVVYKIGDVIKVQVAAVNVEEGQIDFVLEGGALAENTERNFRSGGSNKTPRGNTGGRSGGGKSGGGKSGGDKGRRDKNRSEPAEKSVGGKPSERGERSGRSNLSKKGRTGKHRNKDRDRKNKNDKFDRKNARGAMLPGEDHTGEGERRDRADERKLALGRNAPAARDERGSVSARDERPRAGTNRINVKGSIKASSSTKPGFKSSHSRVSRPEKGEKTVAADDSKLSFRERFMGRKKK
jgi:ribonuclease R